MKKKIILAYCMGLSMGVLLLTLSISFLGGFSSSKDSFSLQAQTMMSRENNKLFEEIESLKVQNKELSEQLQALKIASDKTEESTERKAVKIMISEPIVYEEIAKRLVEEKVYPYENDLLMLMEMLHYDKLKGTKALAEKGIIKDEYGHRNILRKYDTARHEMKKVLFEKGLIQDQEAFAKMLYLLDVDTEILSGEKEFMTGMSLREIADVLMAGN